MPEAPRAPSRRDILRGLAALAAAAGMPAGIAQGPAAPLTAARFGALSTTLTEVVRALLVLTRPPLPLLLFPGKSLLGFAIRFLFYLPSRKC